MTRLKVHVLSEATLYMNRKKNVEITIDIKDSKIPLLLSKDTMKKSDIILDY